MFKYIKVTMLHHSRQFTIIPMMQFQPLCIMHSMKTLHQRKSVFVSYMDILGHKKNCKNQCKNSKRVLLSVVRANAIRSKLKNSKNQVIFGSYKGCNEPIDGNRNVAIFSYLCNK